MLFALYGEPLAKKHLDDHRNAWLGNRLFLLDPVHITLIESKLNEGRAGHQHSAASARQISEVLFISEVGIMKTHLMLVTGP